MQPFKTLFFVMALLSPLFGVNGDEQVHTYLLRAPRSGSHLFFYCCNTLFHSTFHTEASRVPYRNDYYKESGGEKIVTAHNPYDLHLSQNSRFDDRLILLVRNHREAMLRNYETAENVKNEILYQASFNHLAQNSDWVLNLRMNHYFHNFRVYDLWNPEKRLIVYYEDLLQNPREVLLQIAEFIGESGKESEIAAFVNDFETHMEHSIEIYEGPKKGYVSHTQGKSFLHHTEKIGVEKASEIDELVLKYFPDFIEKYLSRYLFDFLL